MCHLDLTKPVLLPETQLGTDFRETDTGSGHRFVSTGDARGSLVLGPGAKVTPRLGGFLCLVRWQVPARPIPFQFLEAWPAGTCEGSVPSSPPGHELARGDPTVCD